MTEPERPKRYRIEESDLAEADREAAFLWQMSLYGPEYAAAWHRSLLDTIQKIAEFPGPLSHPVVREATAERRAVRRTLYYGPKGRRSRTAPRYRILFTVIAPDDSEDEGIIRIQRILHGARADATENEGN